MPMDAETTQSLIDLARNGRRPETGTVSGHSKAYEGDGCTGLHAFTIRGGTLASLVGLRQRFV
jgi:hypothetical protein